MFETLTEAPADAILGLTERYKADPRDGKINLTVGVYKNAQEQTPVLRCVKQAEQRILEHESSKGYLGIAGSADFSFIVGLPWETMTEVRKTLEFGGRLQGEYGVRVRYNWYLHVHMWDPHTPYRSPDSYGEPFADDALPGWLTEEVRAEHWAGAGPHSAREANGYMPREKALSRFPRQPQEIADMTAVRQMFDGYDTGVLMADDYVGRLMNDLADLGIDQDTVIMISSDHGETLGELNVYGDHQTADQLTTRVPMILRWPDKLSAGRFAAKHYQIDVTATLLALLDQPVPDSWDGESFASSLLKGADVGRDYLVLSQAAWACQRGVRFDDWLYLNTRHDAYHLYPDEMLFNLAEDPHQQHDLAAGEPERLARGRDLLAGWRGDMMAGAAGGRDPHDNVMAEGGPFHVRGQLPDYLKRLRATGRSAVADELEARWL